MIARKSSTRESTYARTRTETQRGSSLGALRVVVGDVGGPSSELKQATFTPLAILWSTHRVLNTPGAGSTGSCCHEGSEASAKVAETEIIRKERKFILRKAVKSVAISDMLQRLEGAGTYTQLAARPHESSAYAEGVPTQLKNRVSRTSTHRKTGKANQTTKSCRLSWLRPAEMYCDRCRARLSPTLPQSVSVGLVSAMQCTQPAMRRTTANGGANSLKQHSLESLKTPHPFSSLKSATSSCVRD